MIRMILKDGTRYDLDDEGRVLARSDGPPGWNYAGRWRILGFAKRHRSKHFVSLAEALDGIDVGHGIVIDLDGSMIRQWASPPGHQLRSLKRIDTGGT